MNQKGMIDIIFKDKLVPQYEIFLKRKNVFGLINKIACRQGHVLICSRRVVAKLGELTQIETIDLFMTAQQVQKKLSIIYNTQYEMTMKNGKDAGQTVSHCHIHLYPIHQTNSLEWNHKVRSQQEMKKQNQKYQGMFQQGFSL